jgi:hypothetical protein
MPKRKANKLSSRNLRKRFKHSEPDFELTDPDSEFNKFKRAVSNITVSDSKDFQLPEIWRRNERVMRANVCLKKLVRQDPTEDIDILNISRHQNVCFYTEHDILLIEDIIEKVHMSTLNCNDKKCFYHCRRF